MTSSHVLVVSPASSRRDALVDALRAQGYVVAVAGEGRDGADALAEPGIDLVVLDLRAPDLALSALRTALNPSAPAQPESLDDAERRHIALVLRHTRGNKRQAAIALGISRSTLLHKLRKYEIVIPRT
jgi:DNA-binding NtrC family response regulator